MSNIIQTMMENFRGINFTLDFDEVNIFEAIYEALGFIVSVLTSLQTRLFLKAFAYT